MKLYVVSGLGADFSVLEKLVFNPNIEVVFLEWLLPEPGETFPHYVRRMAERVDDSQPFYLLGYSFGGIIVQEIHKIKRAEKVVILGSIRSGKEKSKLMKFGKISRIPKHLPVGFFNEKTLTTYSFFRKFIDPKNPRILNYFRVRDAHYLKWSIDKILDWESDADPDVIQILGDRDIVFPAKNSRPDYIIPNATHLFPSTRHRQVSEILKKIFV